MPPARPLLVLRSHLITGSAFKWRALKIIRESPLVLPVSWASRVASSPETARLFSRTHANEAMARGLGREMRNQHLTNEKLEKLSGVPERRIEMLRSYTEESPVHLEDMLSIAAVLGPRFLTSIFSELDMYAAHFNGASPERIGAEIIQLAHKLTGGVK